MERRFSIVSVKNNVHVHAFIERLEHLTYDEVYTLSREKNSLIEQRLDDPEMKQRWYEALEKKLNVSATTRQHLDSQVKNVTSNKLDTSVFNGIATHPSLVIADTALLSLKAIVNRHKLTDEEYQWFIGPYLAAGFPREIFYPEDDDTQG